RPGKPRRTRGVPVSNDIAPPVEGTVVPGDAAATAATPDTNRHDVADGSGAGLARSAPNGAAPAGPATATGAVGPAPRQEAESRDGVVVAFPQGGRSGAAPSGPFGLAGAPTGRRVRARLARFNAPWQAPKVSEVLEPLISAHRTSHPKADVRLLQRAYEAADRLHAGQFRKSGDPYITHPLAVATILANLGMDTTTLVAALLHD